MGEDIYPSEYNDAMEDVLPAKNTEWATKAVEQLKSGTATECAEDSTDYKIFRAGLFGY